MPQAALKALEGKLAEGVDPMSVLDELQAAGWTPPEGDESYSPDAPPEPPGPPEPPETTEGEPGAETEPMEAPQGIMLAIGKGSMNERREAAARKAMEKDGYKEDEED